jgi:hypothetical protein
VIAEIPTPHRPAAEAVCAGLSGADRLRRTREAGRRIWRAAPAIAAVTLALAAGGRWAGWPASLAFAVFVAGGAGLAVYALFVRRPHPVTDGLSARVDADATLGGELRSATWFAMHGADSPWVDFHLDRAAARIKDVDWAALYPPVRARRAQVASLLMVAGAVVLTISMPRSARADLSGAAAKTAAAVPADLPEDLMLLLPPELQKQLEALLAASQDRTSSPAARAASIAQLRALLAQLSQLKDRDALNDLARLAEANKDALSADAAEQMKNLADGTNLPTEVSKLPPEIRRALEKLSEHLATTKKPEPGAAKDPSQALAEKNDRQRGETSQSESGADVDEASIQSVKEASAGGGAGVMMMASDDAAMGGEPGMGVGGGSAPANSGRGRSPAVAQALKHETVEANTDNPGDNVITDIKRKTEHGDATVSFTRGAARTFDRSRVAAPPPVPEARRPGVQTYFVRKQ